MSLFLVTSFTILSQHILSENILGKDSNMEENIIDRLKSIRQSVQNTIEANKTDNRDPR
jgi:hypothetical protein